MSEEIKDKSLVYTEDLEFIKWVRSGFEYKNEYWQQKRADTSESSHIDKAIELINAISFKERTESKDRKQLLFDRISASIEDNDQIAGLPKKTEKLRFIIPLSIAASLSLMILFFWPSSDMSSFRTDMAENQNISLPDKSQITINADSWIEYNKEDYTKERIIGLDGEAFFEVEKGNRFVVNTVSGNVEVLGTSFNVLSREGVFEVICETGKVRVTNATKTDELILNPGQSARLSDGKLILETETLKAGWRTGSFEFNEVPLSRVVSELERQYDLDIILDDQLATMKYTGFFESGDMNKAMESVLWPLGLAYETSSDGTIEVIKK